LGNSQNKRGENKLEDLISQMINKRKNIGDYSSKRRYTRPH